MADVLLAHAEYFADEALRQCGEAALQWFLPDTFELWIQGARMYLTPSMSVPLDTSTPRRLVALAARLVSSDADAAVYSQVKHAVTYRGFRARVPIHERADEFSMRMLARASALGYAVPRYLAARLLVDDAIRAPLVRAALQHISRVEGEREKPCGF